MFNVSRTADGEQESLKERKKAKLKFLILISNFFYSIILCYISQESSLKALQNDAYLICLSLFGESWHHFESVVICCFLTIFAKFKHSDFKSE